MWLTRSKKGKNRLGEPVPYQAAVDEIKKSNEAVQQGAPTAVTVEQALMGLEIKIMKIEETTKLAMEKTHATEGQIQSLVVSVQSLKELCETLHECTKRVQDQCNDMDKKTSKIQKDLKYHEDHSGDEECHGEGCRCCHCRSCDQDCERPRSERSRGRCCSPACDPSPENPCWGWDRRC